MRKSSHGQARAASAESAGEKAGDTGTVIVWLKRDLRVDDHPGFAEALAARGALPVYVFDVALLAELPESTVVAIHEGVLDVQRSLQKLRSNLAVEVGPSQEVLPALAQKLGARVVIAEDEVEHSWRQVVSAVEGALQSAGAQLRTWTLPLYSFPEGRPAPSDYKQFVKSRSAPLPPLDPPTSLPPHRTQEGGHEIDADPGQEIENRYWGDGRYELRGGETVAQDALKGYLRFLEATKNESWYRMYSLVRELEARPLTSFPAIFGEALAAGWLSRRRVYAEALRYERDRSGGRLSPFGFSALTAEAAVRTAELADFHWQLSREGHVAPEEGQTGARWWRWRGFLTQYLQKGDRGPAVLLVHGFGAFSQHFHRSVDQLSSGEGGCRVWAVTLPGFGRSEKPRRRYSQELWAEFLADFIANVIREPVILAGNSIGGYCCTTVAADFSYLVRGLVLLNSAGRILPGYTLPPASSLPRKTFGDALPSFVPWGIARLLFAYLDGNVDSILRRCYPVHPDAIERWLVEEIKRAAADPGSVDVFESVFYLPKPRPINFLIDRFGGPVLVVQGRFDPLNDAVRRAEALRAACPGAVSVHLVDAGHCPMDELSGPVSTYIANFAKAPREKRDPPEGEPRPDKRKEEEAGGIAEVVVELAGQSRPLDR
ncbi:DNA photolyase [Klebsormidium nitens]|uniref:DNA photolyase n=1 Tax=Klebsormidium nitens TaxID=105231 RepID=A0A1Y1IEZ7_KLENI|nr:DNA photolyase [Klebsormidium nitens]|eukprot:GAQ88572.1 DNA photolyase [Klebsormidium nitens]